MNLMRVVISPLSLTRTVKDADFREQVGKKFYGPEITLRGQVNLATKPEYSVSNPSRTGDTEPTKGRLVFKKKYLDDLEVVLKKGDLVVEVGPEGAATPINCTLITVRPESPHRGDFLLIYAEFKWDEEQRGSLER